MITDPQVLSPETTVAEAIRLLLTNRVLSMPVVDANRHFLGQFTKKHFLSRLLPNLAIQSDPQHQVERMIEAGLLQDTLEDIHGRYEEIANEPVSLHYDSGVTVLHPDQPLVTALYLLYAGRNALPVVERGSKVLAGVVSTWDLLARVTTQA